MTNIKTLLAQKENRKLEFKRDLPANNKLIKTAIAFLNSQGGDLVIGVVSFSSLFTQIRLEKKEMDETTPITTREKLLVLIKNNSQITRDELAKELDISINTVKEYILKRIGDNRTGYWELKK